MVWQLAEELFKQNANGTAIIVASRYQATNVFTITATDATEHNVGSPLIKPVQLDLFE